MGAELITCALAHENEAELDFEAGRELVRNTAIDDAPAEPFHWIEDEEELQDKYLNAIDMVQGALEGEGYYSTHNAYPFRGAWIHVIGGTTWGDGPGELFDNANALTYWPELLKAMGFLVDWS